MNLKTHSVFQQAGLGWWPSSGCPAWEQPGPGGCARPGALGTCPGETVQFVRAQQNPAKRPSCLLFSNFPLPCTTPGNLGISVSISQARPFMLREAGALTRAAGWPVEAEQDAHPVLWSFRASTSPPPLPRHWPGLSS